MNDIMTMSLSYHPAQNSYCILRVVYTLHGTSIQFYFDKKWLPKYIVYIRVNVPKGVSMLNWAVTFLIIALIAGLLGFGGIAGTATEIAKILFIVFLVLFLVSLLAGRFRR